MALHPSAATLTAGALVGALLTAGIGWARTEPSPQRPTPPTAAERHVIELRMTGGLASNLVVVEGTSKVRQPWSVPFSVVGDLQAVSVFTVASAADGQVDCTVILDDVVVAHESGDGPGGSAHCVWTPGGGPSAAAVS